MRKHYLDNTRYAIVLSVIFYHVVYMFNSIGIIRNVDIQGIPAMDVFIYILYPWFMVCLFIIAGISARHALEKQAPKQFWKSKCRRLLLPSIAGIFLVGWVNGWVTNQYTDMFLGAGDQIPGFVKYLIWCLTGIGPLWFLHQLVICCLCLLLVRKIDSRDRLTALGRKAGLPALFLLVFALWVSAQILNTPLIVFYRHGIYIFSFLLGYYLFAHDHVIALLEKHWALLLAIAAALGTVYTLVYWGQNNTDTEKLKSLLTNAYAWFACQAVLGAGKRFLDRETPFTRYMHRNSFGFYVLHYPLMAALAWALDRFLTPPAWAMYLCLTLFTALLLPPLTALIRRIPVIRTLLLGK